MPLSKPALMSALLCPGVGQWAAGRRLLGAALVAGAVTCAVTPLGAFLWGLAHPPPCDVWNQTALSCTGRALLATWRATLPSLKVAVPLFLLLWVGAVTHAQRLRLP